MSLRLCHLAIEIWEMTAENKMWLTAAHIKGEPNIIADSSIEGEGRIFPGQWSICPRIVKQNFKEFGTPNIDLFASRHKKKLPVYGSWVPDQEAFARDSLSISWDNIWGYVYPPIALIPMVL